MLSKVRPQGRPSRASVLQALIFTDPYKKSPKAPAFGDFFPKYDKQELPIEDCLQKHRLHILCANAIITMIFWGYFIPFDRSVVQNGLVQSCHAVELCDANKVNKGGKQP
ncbi:MAG: hypothetical protein E7425_05525 [Ruminococcaceae bacterium]|nr:hypothetical protein [Oscillospiraceae bacterium]